MARSVNFCEAPEVERIAKELIPRHHTHLGRPDVRIEYVFRDDEPKDKGRFVYAKAHKITGLNAFLAGQEADDLDGTPAMFCVAVTEKIWIRLTEAQRVALVDHELCHCHAGDVEDEKGNRHLELSMLGHDLEEFHAVVQRHGAWDEAIDRMLAAHASHQTAMEFSPAGDLVPA